MFLVYQHLCYTTPLQAIQASDVLMMNSITQVMMTRKEANPFLFSSFITS